MNPYARSDQIVKQAKKLTVYLDPANLKITSPSGIGMPPSSRSLFWIPIQVPYRFSDYLT